MKNEVTGVRRLPTDRTHNRQKTIDARGNVNGYSTWAQIARGIVIDNFGKMGFEGIADQAGISKTTVANLYFGITKRPADSTIEGILEGFQHPVYVFRPGTPRPKGALAVPAVKIPKRK